jgi:hypothetical protein
VADPKLMAFFKFDEADLAANRAGSFTAKQEERLGHQDRNLRLGSLLGAGVALFVALAGLIYGAITLIANRDPESTMEMAVAFGLVVPLVFGFFGVRSLRRAFGRRRFRLAQVKGPVNVSVKKWNNDGVDMTSGELRIGGRKFNTFASLPNAMTNGAEYSVYYVEGTNTILSAEALSTRQ